MITHITSIIFFMCIYIVNSQSETISCGETKTGIRGATEEKWFIFTASKSYKQVYLEGCQSTHDIWLQIRDRSGHTIANEDDEFAHGSQRNCGNQYAGDITIPNAVSNGELYQFIVKGYQDANGYYSVELICTDGETETPTTKAPTTSTTQPPTTSTTQPPTQPPVTCSSNSPRYREAWHLISDEKRQLYIDGFKELYKNGILADFTKEHHESGEHSNTAFLPWHRYFAWKFESAIRNLGGRFACFSLPYWDWTSEIEQHDYDIANWHILNSGLSGIGIGSSGCVIGNFGPNEYITTSEECLKRYICIGSHCSGVYSAPELMGGVFTIETFGYRGDDDKFASELYYVHGWAHCTIGGCGSATEPAGDLGDLSVATDDPIFWLLHSFVDFQYALWQDCLNYEQVDNNEISRVMYGGSGAYALDASIPIKYIPQNNEVTYREMHDITDWNIVYDKGDFFDNAEINNNAMCNGNINSLWFQGGSSRRRRMKGYKRKSDFGEYAEDVFNKLNNKLGGKKKTKKQNKILYQTWGKMSCEYLSIENRCQRPKYFDDCSDMVKGYNDDIDITLAGLIEKVYDYPCMVKVREMFYEWAKSTNDLYGLCRGEYDRFCDTNFRKETGQDKCLAKLKKKKRKII